MYRKESGKMGFSFRYFMTNSNPVFANDNLADDSELADERKDAIFHWQLGTKEFRRLDSNIFYVGGIVGAQSQSKTIQEKLKQLSVISTHPDDFTIYTDRIKRDFPSKFAIISVHAQRKLVGLLFSWEEELIRWNLLEKEQQRIRTSLNGLDTAHDATAETLKLDLARVEAEKRTPPTQRIAIESQQARDDIGDILPSYHDQENTVPVMSGEDS